MGLYAVAHRCRAGVPLRPTTLAWSDRRGLVRSWAREAMLRPMAGMARPSLLASLPLLAEGGAGPGPGAWIWQDGPRGRWRRR